MNQLYSASNLNAPSNNKLNTNTNTILFKDDTPGRPELNEFTQYKEVTKGYDTRYGYLSEESTENLKKGLLGNYNSSNANQNVLVMSANRFKYNTRSKEELPRGYSNERDALALRQVNNEKPRNRNSSNLGTNLSYLRDNSQNRDNSNTKREISQGIAAEYRQRQTPGERPTPGGFSPKPSMRYNNPNNSNQPNNSSRLESLINVLPLT